MLLFGCTAVGLWGLTWPVATILGDEHMTQCGSEWWYRGEPDQNSSLRMNQLFVFGFPPVYQSTLINSVEVFLFGSTVGLLLWPFLCGAVIYHALWVCEDEEEEVVVVIAVEQVSTLRCNLKLWEGGLRAAQAAVIGSVCPLALKRLHLLDTP